MDQPRAIRANMMLLSRKALELAGNTTAKALPITSTEWPSPARRPSNSVLRPYAMEMQGMPQPMTSTTYVKGLRKRTEQGAMMGMGGDFGMQVWVNPSYPRYVQQMI